MSLSRFVTCTSCNWRGPESFCAAISNQAPRLSRHVGLCPKCGCLVSRPESKPESTVDISTVSKVITERMADTDESRSFAVSATLADLLHYCDHHELDFARLEREARVFYLTDLEQLKKVPT